MVNAIPLLCSPTWKRVAALLVLNREGGLRPDCVVWLGAVVSILVVTLLPLGAWVMLGRGAFPLVVGLVGVVGGDLRR